MAEILGVKPKENGSLDGVKLFSACLNVQANSAVQALPKDQRLRVIKSVADALEALRLQLGEVN